jgi:hypothetical protein
MVVMRKNKYLEDLRIFYLSICIFFLFISILDISALSEEDSSLIIEVSSDIIESETEFYISVYDPSIQIGTPYLVNVTILFDDKFFEITPQSENSEIILNAPKVNVNKTYTIQAFTSNKKGNRTVLIIPKITNESKELVITPNSYSLNAFEDFSIIVTNKNGKPIPNVTIYLGNSIISDMVAKTNENGSAILTAPNQEQIRLIAQKQGYFQDIEYLSVSMKYNTINEVMSHPFTPVIIALLILIMVILYVSLFKKSFQKPHPQISENNIINHLKQRTYRITTHEDEIPYKVNQKITNTSPQTISVIENIQNQINAKYNKDINNQRNTKENNKFSYRWFDSLDNLPRKKKISDCNKKNSDQNCTDDIHKKIDKILADHRKTIN